MPLVGNDVVDLAEPENVGKSGDHRFCRRVFNSAELSLINSFPCPDAALWAIWAAKEAAYKAISRHNPDVCSIPKKYPVIIEISTMTESPGSLPGKVMTPLGELPVLISIDPEMIHAIATGAADDLQRIISRVVRIDPDSTDPHQFVRKALLEEIARCIGGSVAELSVAKEEWRPWPPFIIFKGSRLLVDISLSHDGRFVAYAFSFSEF